MNPATDIELGPVDTRPPVLTWVVRGAKACPGGVVEYTGITWGRTEDQAQRNHRNQREILARNIAAGLQSGPLPDFAGMTFTFTALPQ